MCTCDPSLAGASENGPTTNRLPRSKAASGTMPKTEEEILRQPDCHDDFSRYEALSRTEGTGRMQLRNCWQRLTCIPKTQSPSADGRKYGGFYCPSVTRRPVTDDARATPPELLTLFPAGEISRFSANPPAQPSALALEHSKILPTSFQNGTVRR